MKGKLGIRILVLLFAGLVFGFVVSEAAYLLIRKGMDRNPTVVQLVIPAGTAAKVAAGQSEPSLPEEMVFVQGDTLVVKNEDSANHTLGPVFVPAGTTGTLILNDASNLSYACTFEPSQYFGLSVQPRLDWTTRINGTLSIGLPTTCLLLLYSIVVYPLNKTETIDHD